MRAFFSRVGSVWKRVAHAIGVFQTGLLLTLLYYLLFVPVALIVRWRRDPLDLRARRTDTAWRPGEDPPRGLDDLSRQSS